MSICVLSRSLFDSCFMAISLPPYMSMVFLLYCTLHSFMLPFVLIGIRSPVHYVLIADDDSSQSRNVQHCLLSLLGFFIIVYSHEIHCLCCYTVYTVKMFMPFECINEMKVNKVKMSLIIVVLFINFIAKLRFPKLESFFALCKVIGYFDFHSISSGVISQHDYNYDISSLSQDCSISYCSCLI